jgi:hypothetical protein
MNRNDVLLGKFVRGKRYRVRMVGYSSFREIVLLDWTLSHYTAAPVEVTFQSTSDPDVTISAPWSSFLEISVSFTEQYPVPFGARIPID